MRKLLLRYCLPLLMLYAKLAPEPLNGRSHGTWSAFTADRMYCRAQLSNFSSAFIVHSCVKVSVVRSGVLNMVAIVYDIV